MNGCLTAIFTCKQLSFVMRILTRNVLHVGPMARYGGVRIALELSLCVGNAVAIGMLIFLFIEFSIGLERTMNLIGYTILALSYTLAM
jgi:hypothetical protein